MRIYTVARGDQPLVVVRASHPTEAIDIALAMIPQPLLPRDLDAREPNDAEMVGWLERRQDYMLEPASAG
jgi:hypothetical protein